jgi:hypothetical protein
MSRAKVTLSLPGSVADYLRSKPNASAVVAEAVAIYQARELEEVLKRAYREDAAESRELHDEWSAVDSEVDE